MKDLDNYKKNDNKDELNKITSKKDNLYLEDVRQGVIWSQILEKPRSKNPYFSSKRI